MTKICKRNGDTAMRAQVATRGIPRYHEEFSVRVPARNTIPPHSAITLRRVKFHIMDERGIITLEGTPRLLSTVSVYGAMAAVKNESDIATRARGTAHPDFMVSAKRILREEAVGRSYRARVLSVFGFARAFAGFAPTPLTSQGKHFSSRSSITR